MLERIRHVLILFFTTTLLSGQGHGMETTETDDWADWDWVSWNTD